MVLKKVSFGITKIQALRRVALDANLLETLGLDVGDLVRVELDTEHATILISRVSDNVPEQAHPTSNPRRPRAKGK